MSITISGFDRVQRKLRDLQHRAQTLHGEHSVKFDELFPSVFMKQYTEFGSMAEMLKASGFTAESADDFASIPDDEWNRFVAQRTRFQNWHEMKAAAGRKWVARRLGF